MAATFMGGSAYSMAREIGDGYVAVTDRTFGKLSPEQRNKLRFEMERYLRELRGTAVANLELPELQARNRKIQRLTSALMIERVHRQRAR